MVEVGHARKLIDRLDHATLGKAFRGELFIPKEAEVSSAAANDISNNGRK